MARPERFELPTTWFVARYSIQLSYGRLINSRVDRLAPVQPKRRGRIIPEGACRVKEKRPKGCGNSGLASTRACKQAEKARLSGGFLFLDTSQGLAALEMRRRRKKGPPCGGPHSPGPSRIRPLSIASSGL